MDTYKSSQLAGAKIFRLAVEHIQKYGWDHNSMDILLAVTPGKRWLQPMAVFMFSELSNQLGSETLTQFDQRIKDQATVIKLFEQVATNLESA